ncbi:MAG: AAA family ATPase [Phycisphaeraceae bacterium]|nr:AAA family ATPase [Phycisphaeraceae bacterium]
MRIITVINQKGGCGKTTTAINLAAAMARGGLRSLLVDLDPQSHCAVGLGIPETRIDLDISDVLVMPNNRPIDTTRLLWRVGRNLDLAPSRMKLAGLEAARGGLADKPDKERRLAQVLDRLKTEYDVALVDCSPAIGLLTFNAIAAANTVLIPVETGFFALQGATRQLTTIKTLAKRLGVEIPIAFVPTLHDESSTVSHDLLGELQRRFGHQLSPIVIRRDPKLREAASFGQPAIEHAPDSPGTKDYLDLARWVASRLNLKLSGFNGPDPAWSNRTPIELKPEVTTPIPSEFVPGETPVGATKSAAEQPVGLRGPMATSGGAATAGADLRAALLQQATSPTPLAQERDTPPTDIVPLAAASPTVHFPTAAPLPPPPAASATEAPSVYTPFATSAAGQLSGSEEQPRPTSRAAELVHRAQRLLRRVTGEKPEEHISTTPLRFEPPVPEIKLHRAADPDRRLLGVRVTPQGVLFVQPQTLGQRVAIAGSFNNWSENSHVMRLNEDLGILELCVPIEAGSYQYRLVVDGNWTADPHNSNAELNPFGELNSVVTVLSNTAARMDMILERQGAA